MRKLASKRCSFVLALSAGAVVLAGLGARIGSAAQSDEAASIAAFREVAKVLNHPRCMNCHTTVDWPTQGDDRLRHAFNVSRGQDGRGPAGMRCATCHKDENQDAANVPGAKDWRAAPPSMGWTGLSPGALCRAVLDPAKNGGRTGAKVIEHLRADPLVLWAWSPGGKRPAPELAHDTFVGAAEIWIKKGARCPSP